MKNLLGRGARVALAVLLAACGTVENDAQEGGANANDRSGGGEVGERLETGAMVVSPNGAWIVARRNTTALFVDVKNQRLREVDGNLGLSERWIFSPARDVVYAMLPQRMGIVAVDLATGAQLWSTMPAFVATSGAIHAKVTSDDRTLLVSDYGRVFVIDAKTGDVRGVAKAPGLATDLELLPDGRHAVVVGETSWETGSPLTDVTLVDVAKVSSTSIEVPNCAAPVAIVPDGSRALLSPTFCTPGSAPVPKSGWRNPDPVSVIDVDAQAGTLRFVKNLPGFGPVALLPNGRAVAYLDTKRIDRAMFDDPSQIPGADAPQYHLMLIDPATMKFDVHPIGAALPRFAPATDGRSLLVDATSAVVRSEATATITLDETGFRAQLGAFDDPSGSLFGVFDLETNRYVPFAGPPAALDRFVQLGDGSQVFTLKNDGRGGALFAIDLSARTTIDLNRSLRDIGILPDGRTLVLRIRLESTADGRLREEFCFSRDARTCEGRVEYVGAVPQHDP